MSSSYRTASFATSSLRTRSSALSSRSSSRFPTRDETTTYSASLSQPQPRQRAAPAPVTRARRVAADEVGACQLSAAVQSRSSLSSVKSPASTDEPTALGLTLRRFKAGTLSTATRRTPALSGPSSATASHTTSGFTTLAVKVDRAFNAKIEAFDADYRAPAPSAVDSDTGITTLAVKLDEAFNAKIAAFDADYRAPAPSTVDSDAPRSVAYVPPARRTLAWVEAQADRKLIWTPFERFRSQPSTLVKLDLDDILERLAGLPCPFEESWTAVIWHARYRGLKSMSEVIDSWLDANDRRRVGNRTYPRAYHLAHGGLFKESDSELCRRARKISLLYAGEMPQAEAFAEPREDFSASNATSLPSPPGSVRSERTTTPVPSPSTPTVAEAVQTSTDARPITLEIPQDAAPEHRQTLLNLCRALRADRDRHAADQAEPAEEVERLMQPSWISSAWTSVCSWVSTRMTSLSSWWT